MKTLLLILTLLGTGAVIGWIRHLELRDLRQQNAVLRQAADERRVLAEQLKALPPAEVDWDELGHLRQSRHELFRLRGEIGLLRQADQLAPEATQETVEQILGETEKAKARTEAIRAAERARKTPEAAYAALRGLLTVHQEVSASLGRQPATMEELKAGADLLYGPGAHFPLGLKDRILGPVEDFFELVPPIPGTPASAPVPLLRERTPRQNPNGGWVRLYAFSNGIHEVDLPENRFDSWERELRYSPEPEL